MAGILDFLMGASQPQQPQDMAQGILSGRFQPQQFQPGLSDYSSAIMRSINGQPTSGQDVASGRINQTMQMLADIDKMQQVRLALGKFNLDQQTLEETMRHNKATEGLNPQGIPITDMPMAPPTGNNVNVGQINIPPGMNSAMPNLIRAESGGNPNAISPAGAAGAMQIMPDTARNPGYGVTPLQGWDGMDPRTAPPQEQLRFANDYFNAMQAHNGGSPQLAAAAYNAGPGTVDRAAGDISRLPQETQNYVPQVASTNAPLLNGRPRMTPQGEGFTPLFKGNEIFKDNLPQNFAYMRNPAGGIMARQVPGTIEKGANGEILQTDAQGNVTQQIPQNPQMKAKLEQNLQKIADRFDELHKIGGTVDDITETNPIAAIGQFAGNKATQLAASTGLDVADTQVLPGGQTLLQGTKAATLRGEIRDLIKQTTPLYMQAMGITPGMERAVSAQQMLQDALGGAVGKSRQQNLFSLANLSQQAGTGELANKLSSQQQSPGKVDMQTAIQHAQEAISQGADPKAVLERLKGMGIQ